MALSTSTTFLAVLILITANELHFALSFSCKNSAGVDVAWFIVYKIPRITKQKKDDNIREGTASFYMDDTKNWTYETKPINGKEHAIYHTLNPLYDQRVTKDEYILYNDHPPDKPCRTDYGHAKGVLLSGESEGFWMVHSLPRFPAAPGTSPTYSWAKNVNNKDETTYGQIFLCITFSSAELGKIKKHIKFFNPYIYEEEAVTSTKTKVSDEAPITDDYCDCDDNMSSKQREKMVEREAKRRRLVSLTTAHKDQSATDFKLLYIAKQHGKEKDEETHLEIYSYLAARLQLQEVYTQTWRNGKRCLKLPSCFGKMANKEEFKVQNIGNLTFASERQTITFRTTKDHSKWAVSKNGQEPWTCIGDLNRMRSQEKRGGGLVCLYNPRVMEQFYSLISNFDRAEEGKYCPTSYLSFYLHETETFMYRDKNIVWPSL